MNKSLAQLSSLPYNAVPFGQFGFEELYPALQEAVATAKQKIKIYREETKNDYQAVIEDLEKISENIDYLTSIFYNLHGAHNTPEITKDAQNVSTLLTDYSSSITLDDKIFQRIKKLYDHQKNLNLTQEQTRILEKYYSDFKRNGALLSPEKKTELKILDEALSSASLKYSENNLNETKEYVLNLTNDSDVDGLPETMKEMLAEKAKEKGLKGYAVTLDHSISQPFLKYAKNRQLREKFWRSLSSKSYHGTHDNSALIKEIVELRIKRAKLLGYKNHAEFVLEKRMAQNIQTVNDFAQEIFEKAQPAAQRDAEKLKKLALELDGIKDFRKWDTAYYTEKLKERELNFDDEKLRPYFPVNQVVNGLFEILSRLYQVNFKKLDVPTYHPEVDLYQVAEKNGEHIGLLYLDLFPRDTKRQGGWMTSFLEQGMFQGEVRRPLISIVCNFTKPTTTAPSLLALQEVLTLFHEFGHALHGLFSKCRYRTLSGTNVFWDFVELPSQILENWVLEPECLKIFGKHYQTGEVLPQNLIDAIVKNKQFFEGMMTLRQQAFAQLDMSWHTLEKWPSESLESFEANSMKKFSFFPREAGECSSTSFSHIFAGGYSAGYYSYKWAEVLDADAFESFKQEGIFNQATARRFRKLLETGGAADPMSLYLEFKGKKPSVDALVKRAGL
jgi:Zn-dependent oligopeptidase